MSLIYFFSSVKMIRKVSKICGTLLDPTQNYKYEYLYNLDKILNIG